MKTDWQSAARNLAKAFPKNRLERRARELLDAAENENSAREEIALACSGGADSLAALLLVFAHFPKLRERFVALHFNHATRGEASDGDEIFVREISRALGIACVAEKLSGIPAAHSEFFLREKRLDFFARAMRSRGAKILIQGHQRDDVAETILMRLVRGAGTAGLAAPRVISCQCDGRIFARPLLGIGKNALLAALRENAIPWREDASNAGTDFFRNRVRKNVLPALREASPFATETLRGFARSRDLLAEDADALDAWSERIFAENFRRDFSENSAAGEKIFAFPQNLPRAIVRRLVWKIFSAEKISPKSAACADALVDAICAGTAEIFALPDGKFLAETTRAGTLILREKFPSRENFAAPFDFRFPLEKLPVRKKIFSAGNPARERAEISAEIVPTDAALFQKIFAGTVSADETVFLSTKNFAGTELFVRAWRKGERFRPLGAAGEKTLGDAFTDKKIPREKREKLPIFADAAGIAWVPGLAPAERFRLAGTEKSALRLTYREETLLL